jgi:hypothetical protein
MDALKEIFTYFIAAMAMLALLCSVYEAMNQRVSSALLLAGIFVACALLMYLPQLETFKAFGVEAKLQQKLDRAEEILGKMRQLSIASAKAAYLNLAWSNRLGGIEPRDKQKTLDAINAQLRTVGISDDEWREIVRPYIELIGYDLYFVFYNAARSAVSHYAQTSQSDGRKTQAETLKLVQEWDAKWTPTGLDALTPFLSDGQRFTAYMKQEISPSFIEPAAYDKLVKLADTIGALYEECRERGGYTDKALLYLQEYNKGNNGELAGYYAKLMASP